MVATGKVPDLDPLEVGDGTEPGANIGERNGSPLSTHALKHLDVHASGRAFPQNHGVGSYLDLDAHRRAFRRTWSSRNGSHHGRADKNKN